MLRNIQAEAKEFQSYNKRVIKTMIDAPGEG